MSNSDTDAGDLVGFVIIKSATGTVSAEPVRHDEGDGGTVVGDGDVSLSGTAEVVSAFAVPG